MQYQAVYTGSTVRTCARFWALYYCKLISMYLECNKMMVVHYRRGANSLVKFFSTIFFCNIRKMKLIWIRHTIAQMFCDSLKKRNYWIGMCRGVYIRPSDDVFMARFDFSVPVWKVFAAESQTMLRKSKLSWEAVKRKWERNFRQSKIGTRRFCNSQ